MHRPFLVTAAPAILTLALAWPAAARAATAAVVAAMAAMEEPAASHPFSAVDMQSMLRLTEPQASPRGDLIAFAVRTSDFAANRGKNDLWLVAADGSGARPLTSDGAGYGNARWSPDGGALYFLSTRSGSSQIWRLSPMPT